MAPGGRDVLTQTQGQGKQMVSALWRAHGDTFLELDFRFGFLPPPALDCPGITAVPMSLTQKPVRVLDIETGRRSWLILQS